MKQADQKLYNQASIAASAAITHSYTTSFGWAIRLLPARQRHAIYSIYGFVRLADELVDSYPPATATELLRQLKNELKAGGMLGASINPVVHAYLEVRREYQFDPAWTKAFLDSMEMDLTQRSYSQEEYRQYIYGSAEVIGLMCLRVFVDQQRHAKLAPAARSLGSAFQKVNFLRDFASDHHDRERVYFPGVSFEAFNDAKKEQIEREIADEFQQALEGLNRLPWASRIAVAVATKYYAELLQSIRATSAKNLKQERVRIANSRKLLLAIKVGLTQGLARRKLKLSFGSTDLRASV